MGLKRVIKKENEKKILELIENANSPEYNVSWDEKGIPQFKKKSEIAKGKKSKQAGLKFESKVRENLESMGWVVSKWMNTVNFEGEGNIGKLAPAKRKYNPFSKVMTIGTGFPDFICFKKQGDFYEVIGVEVKSNGSLSKQEKGQLTWLIENKVFSRILIAKKVQEGKRSKVEYLDFNEKYYFNKK